MKKEEKHRIRLCSGCGKPVIGTFAMRYKEFGCVECNLWWAMFNDLERIEYPSDEQWKEYLRRKKDWADDLIFIALRHGGALCDTNNISVMRCDCESCIKYRKVKPKFWKRKGDV